MPSTRTRLLIGAAIVAVVLVVLGILLDRTPRPGLIGQLPIGLVLIGLGLAGLYAVLQEALIGADLARRLRGWRNSRRAPTDVETRLGEARQSLQEVAGVAVLGQLSVERQRLPARTVVALHGSARASDLEPRVRQELLPALSQQGIAATGGLGIFFLEQDQPDPLTTVWLPVAAHTVAKAPLLVHQFSEQEMVVARNAGPGIEAEEALDRVVRFARDEGLSLADPAADNLGLLPFARFVGGPAADVLDAEFTEVCWPLADCP